MYVTDLCSYESKAESVGVDVSRSRVFWVKVTSSRTTTTSTTGTAFSVLPIVASASTPPIHSHYFTGSVVPVASFTSSLHWIPAFSQPYVSGLTAAQASIRDEKERSGIDYRLYTYSEVYKRLTGKGVNLSSLRSLPTSSRFSTIAI